ncbi:MAG TPA: copper chaperone PCu(A)C [Allosphingosinicella sp.]|nr:copper chaperone PCu(A)C [Allosphingosinicella sp.]
MRLALTIGVAGCVIGGCDYRPPEPKVTVEDAWVQLPPVPGRPASAYFTLTSNNDPTKLVAVTSPRAERIELHETRAEGGVSRMRSISDTTFPSDLKLVFAPGGRHAMVFGVKGSIAPGDTIPLTFTFEPAPPVTVEAKVRAFGQGHGSH